MNHELDPEHTLLRDTVRSFAEAEIAPVAAKLDEQEEFSVDLTRRMGELGLFGIAVPEEYGGQGMDYLAYVIATEELARVDGSQAATVTAGNSLGIAPIYYFGTEAQRQRYLPGLCSGERLWAFGLTEPGAGSDSRASATRAEPIDGGWRLNGSKIFITNASSPISEGVTVQAVTGGVEGRPELSCFLVEHGTAGFTATTMHGKLMWRGSDTAELSFADCDVPTDALLGEQGAGSRQMLETLDTGRLGIAAMGLGAAQGAFELALDYAKHRTQFGHPIGSFQGISFQIADMAMEIDHARTYLYRAARLKDAGREFRTEAAMAKLYCTEVAGRVTDAAVQIHGGYGLMKDSPVERFYRDHRILRIGEGTSEIQRLVIARALGL
ncbi:MAG: acyl-CoA dehydrogenase [Acidimicrobiia bacterium]|nr:acyl-CoA dehydrogenase family protein [Acidimicrobiia bacterium]NNF08856.1 acyl-CoA dehydrogenase [Acidimicrobiia bacterium]NNL70961.1 acyl-CoA dehydrogenase [Acidimicrobiia bacterium]